ALYHPREIPGNVWDWSGVHQLAHERPDRDVDEFRRRRPAGDDEYVSIEIAGIVSFDELGAARRRLSHEVAREGCRIGDAVLAADQRAGDVVSSKATDDRRLELLDGNTQGQLPPPSLPELRHSLVCGRKEDVSDLFEQRRAEPGEESSARLRQAHLPRAA